MEPVEVGEAVRVFTATRAYSGNDRLDITLAQQDSVGRLYAPDPEVFRLYNARKQAGLATLADWQQYEEAYRAKLELDLALDSMD